MHSATFVIWLAGVSPNLDEAREADLFVSSCSTIRFAAERNLNSAQQFLDTSRPGVPSCLVLDARIPGLSGLDQQKRLTEVNIDIPIVFITGHGDIPMSVRAMMTRLRTSEVAIKVHRGQVMQKMQAESLADLVKMSEKIAGSRARNRNSQYWGRFSIWQTQ